MTNATTHTIQLPESAAGKRLDASVTIEINAIDGVDLSRAYVQNLIKGGALILEGKVVTQPSLKMKGGEEVALTVPPAESLDFVGEDIPLDIIHEDDHLIVINKPAGMTVHPAVGANTGTLVHALLHHCKESLSGINGVERPGIVHRLDKDTTGLIVCAKDDVTHRHLAAQFADKTAGRTYQALCYGVPRQRIGVVDIPLARDPKNRLRMAVIPPVVGSEAGKEAVTHYKVLQTFGEKISLIQCTLETGRTHQIRVHMAHLGHPIAADHIYARKRTLAALGDKVEAAHAALPHQLLHAAELTFIHPATEERVTFTAPKPKSFQSFLDMLPTG